MGPFVRIGGTSYQFKTLNAFANRHVELMRINHTSKRFPAPLTTNSFTQQIIILGEQDSPERRGTIQEFGIFKSGGHVILRRQHVNAAQSQLTCNRAAHMNIEVEIDAHSRFRRSKNFCLKIGSEASDAISSASRHLR